MEMEEEVQEGEVEKGEDPTHGGSPTGPPLKTLRQASRVLSFRPPNVGRFVTPGSLFFLVTPDALPCDLVWTKGSWMNCEIHQGVIVDLRIEVNWVKGWFFASVCV